MTRGKPIVFLGGGRITSALLAGLRLARFSQPFLVYDRNPEKLRSLRREFRVQTAPELKDVVSRAGLLIVAVRPASVKDLLAQVSHIKSLSAVGVSLAAGIPLKNLKQFAPSIRWVRAMPSPACRVGRGLTALAFAPQFPLPQRKRVRQLFTAVGPLLEIPERDFDTFTVTYSASHGYHALAALAHAAQAQGLNRHTALTAAAHALADAVLAWREGGHSLEALLHEAATPGGIAAATMNAMDQSGYQQAIARGIKAGLAQARRNARL